MKNLKQALQNGEILTGMFCLMNDPSIIELMGYAGFDFVIVDCEEAGLDVYGTETEACIRACAAAGIAPMVRPIEARPAPILKALNFGAQGVFAPHVSTKAQAETVGRACRYPPQGIRSSVPIPRAAKYGFTPWETYREEANANTLAMIMIEEVPGGTRERYKTVEPPEEILAAESIDGVLPGGWDIATDLGIARYGTPAEETQQWMERIIRAARDRGLFVAAHAWNNEIGQKYVDMGAQMILLSLDITMMLTGARDLKRTIESIDTTKWKTVSV